jgi:hypothetical protein
MLCLTWISFSRKSRNRLLYAAPSSSNRRTTFTATFTAGAAMLV